MNKFSDFGIKVALPAFTGDKVKIDRVLNREIIVHDFKIEISKFKGNCLYLQIEFNNVRHVLFTGSKALMDAIEQVDKSGFPFTTTIVKENERLEFS